MTNLGKRTLTSETSAAFVGIGVTIFLCIFAILPVLHIYSLIMDWSGYARPVNSITGPNPSILRGGLELLYFVANIVVTLIAILALQFAAKQAKEAEKSRLAQVYMEIANRYVAPEIVDSRIMTTVLQFRHQKSVESGETNLTLPRYVHQEMEALRQQGTEEGLRAYSRYLEILAFFENVGLLVNEGYLRIDNMKSLFASAIKATYEMYAHHIEQRRDNASELQAGPRLFENFEMLYQAVT